MPFFLFINIYFILTRSFLQASEIDSQIVTQHREQSKAPNTKIRLPLILEEKLKQKDPSISVALAAIPPLYGIIGLGQVYNGQIEKGLVLLGLGQVSANTWRASFDRSATHIAITTYFSCWIWSVIDAYRTAKSMKTKQRSDYSPNSW